jgi:hypothetical protein
VTDDLAKALGAFLKAHCDEQCGYSLYPHNTFDGEGRAQPDTWAIFYDGDIDLIALANFVRATTSSDQA